MTNDDRTSETATKTGITVQLSGEDGNAFAVIAIVLRAMRRAGIPQDQRDEYVKEATSGDYNHLLAVTMTWVEVA